jgi:hypothetical protein
MSFVAVLTCSHESVAEEPTTVIAPLAEAAAPAVPTTPPLPTVRHVDINHVLSTGQSLSTGANGVPALTRTQPFHNVMFGTGVMAGSEMLVRFVPLVEGGQETMSSAFANLATGVDHEILVSAHGVNGAPYWAIKRGTKPYAIGLAQMRAAREVARANNQSYVVRAVTTVHGESDHVIANRNYESDLLAWQADYERDARALTGQTEPVPMFETQTSSWTRYGTTTSVIPGLQLSAHVDSSGKIVLVGPKYHLSYSGDGIHLTSEGYRHMGEDYAKAYRRVVIEGGAWEPVRPKSVTRAGDVVTATFFVPSPPLALDTTLVTNPGDYGFEYVDETGATPKIASVSVTAPDTVAITLSAPPTGTQAHLRYAYTGVLHAKGGPTTGPRGNLRDSDATVSRSGDPLYNWCVHFDEPVR